MSAPAVPPAIPASRRAERTVDRVKVVIPVEVYGDAGARRKFATFLARHLPDTFAVTHRVDTGIIVRVDVARPTTSPSPAGAVGAAATVLVELERTLERIGARSRDRGRALESLLPYVVVKVNG